MDPAEFQVEGELSDAAIDALADMLLALGEADEETT